ncbi:SGNH/GDSL hydrolase family protein [Mechercharimyces sp. CAU 1602]|uniref:SGNH/GDSL hydrolase family protein n=1 Tax=Mechercharimyces sp. CAU 1602 TaxID=2973933 RepID=UPI002163604E|nr:SGNH/GDSL hydrolase family protein [Mechercharimyces sp. CAU 1602]MCS1351605.1 SGNH/GDSL hydrolase family protein [Mechercharimyces sp. CAU 1602]
MKKWKKIVFILITVSIFLTAYVLDTIILKEPVVGEHPSAQQNTLSINEPKQPTPSTSWISTWSTAHQPPSGAAQTGITNRTLRMIIRPSIGGNKVRVHLTNPYGDTAVAFKEVTIGLVKEGATLVPGSLHTATFDGKQHITLAVGEEVYSDPINMVVSPETDIAINLYIPGRSGAMSWHRIAKQTSYLSTPGNYSLDPSEHAFASSLYSWFYIAGLDVQRLDQTFYTLVTVGDSITDGSTSTQDNNQRYPNHLATLLRQEDLPIAVVNTGISGNKLLRDHPIYGEKLLGRFQRDVLQRSGVTDVIVLIGINDIGAQPTISAETMIAGYRKLIREAHDQDVRIYLGTLLPYKGARFYTAEGERVRQQVNEWIRQSGEADAVIDFEHALQDPADPQRLLPIYDSGDHLHPSDLGYQKMAQTAYLSLLP